MPDGRCFSKCCGWCHACQPCHLIVPPPPGAWSSTRANCKRFIEKGSCIPSNVYLGYAMTGTAYSGIGAWPPL